MFRHGGHHTKRSAMGTRETAEQVRTAVFFPGDSVKVQPLGDLDHREVRLGLACGLDEPDDLLWLGDAAVNIDTTFAHLELQLAQPTSVVAEGELLALVALVSDFVGTRSAQGLAALFLGQNVQGQHGSPHNYKLRENLLRTTGKQGTRAHLRLAGR